MTNHSPPYCQPHKGPGLALTKMWPMSAPAGIGCQQAGSLNPSLNAQKQQTSWQVEHNIAVRTWLIEDSKKTNVFIDNSAAVQITTSLAGLAMMKSELCGVWPRVRRREIAKNWRYPYILASSSISIQPVCCCRLRGIHSQLFTTKWQLMDWFCAGPAIILTYWYLLSIVLTLSCSLNIFTHGCGLILVMLESVRSAKCITSGGLGGTKWYNLWWTTHSVQLSSPPTGFPPLTQKWQYQKKAKWYVICSPAWYWLVILVNSVTLGFPWSSHRDKQKHHKLVPMNEV